MQFMYTADYRSQAEVCFRRSETTSDTASRLQWLTLANAWLLMAENAEINVDNSWAEPFLAA